jgi:hypothetical protein
MSQVRFYPALFNFKKLIELTTLYPSSTDFAFLVFQLEMEDSNKNRDEYVLTGYVVGSDWSVKKKLDSSFISADYQADPYKHSGKLYFSNYPLSRSKVDAFKNMDPTGEQIEHLYFEPAAYPRQKKYVHYHITAIYMSLLISKSTGADTDLNPSPPADPSDA